MQEVLRSRIEQQLQAGGGLSNADYTVLVALSEAPDGRLRAHQLSNELGWEKSRLHHQLTRMCKRGLVERRSGGSRAMYAVLTP
ncbi:MarR family transcriptional regulator, partial [Streptomyces sp. SID1328]|nr:MarR family transcriptional regulator [Streptomyces sp. SID1328]